jgi:hypothetical protein
VEQADLGPGTHLMYRDLGTVVRLAHDPRQIGEPAALALLCLRLPRLVGDMQVERVQPTQ